jgi:hypothetical protein
MAERVGPPCGTLPQIVVEQLFPGCRMQVRRLRYHAIKVEQDGIESADGKGKRRGVYRGLRSGERLLIRCLGSPLIGDRRPEGIEAR